MNIFKRKLSKKGFTLAELLIVVAIVAILIAIAIPIYTSAMQDAQLKVNQSNARALRGAATSYILTHWTEGDGSTTVSPAPHYSTGADVPATGGTAPGWYAWATFDENGTMGTVTVRVDSGTDPHSDLVTKKVETAEASFEKSADPDTGWYALNSSGSVTNENLIIVHLKGTAINK